MYISIAQRARFKKTIYRNGFAAAAKGSWKWQKRYHLNRYKAVMCRDGRFVWRYSDILNDKVKPQHRDSSKPCLHNKLLSLKDLYRLCKKNKTDLSFIKTCEEGKAYIKQYLDADPSFRMKEDGMCLAYLLISSAQKTLAGNAPKTAKSRPQIP